VHCIEEDGIDWHKEGKQQDKDKDRNLVYIYQGVFFLNVGVNGEWLGCNWSHRWYPVRVGLAFFCFIFVVILFFSYFCCALLVVSLSLNFFFSFVLVLYRFFEWALSYSTFFFTRRVCERWMDTIRFEV
jgi:hypothetical protein